MTVTDFKDNYLMYENMSIWEVKTLQDFFKTDINLFDIFEKEYGFSFNELSQQENFPDTPILVVSKLLDYFGDKQFFVFSNNDQHHHELKALQDKKVINFGIDIHVLHPTSIYVLEMDKTKDMKMYDR